MGSCAYTLTLGKRHFKYAPSAYKVCITPTQARKLFGTLDKPKPLGCGVFACAFAHTDPDKIVKITRDPSDVAGLLQGQGLPQIPRVYDSHRLVGRPRWVTPRQRTSKWRQWPDDPEAYAIVVERLRPLTGNEKSTWNRRIQRMRLFQNAIERRDVERAVASGPTTVLLPSTPKAARERFTIGGMAKAVCPKRPAREAQSCQLRVRELNKMSADLRERGVEWSDIHAGNIGVDKHGRWKAIDVGASTTPLTTRLPALASARGYARRDGRGGKRS